MNSLGKTKKRRELRPNNQILGRVLSIVDEGSLTPRGGQVSLASTLVETNLSPTVQDEDDVQYEFKEEDAVSSCYVRMAPDCVEGISCSTVSQASSTSSSETSGNTPTSVQTVYDPVNGGLYIIGPAAKVINPIPANNRKGVISRLQVGPGRPSNIGRRDDKRRATHNEVERRRRDKINNWILKLSKIIPDCKQESSKGSLEAQSKGGILAKACDYITELRESNQRLIIFAKENEQLLSEVETLSREIKELRKENERLRAASGAAKQP